MNTESLTLLVKKIVSSQTSIIGPLAVEQANHVNGLTISADLKEINIKGSSDHIIENLVKQYEKLFGQASVEVCKDAVKEVMSQVSAKDIPDILK